MSKELIGVVLIVVLIVMICLRWWIAAAMAIVGFVGIWLVQGFPQACSALYIAPFANLSNYTISAVPMFALMGMVIAETNIGKNLYAAMYRFFGRFRGGMASATVTAAGILGAITGAEDVAAVIMTKIALPQMREMGYDDELSTASIAGGSPLAIIIPPSMPLILFGMLTETNVAKLFIGGVGPGICLIICFICAITLVCTRHPEKGPKGPKFSWKEKGQALLGCLPILILFLCVLGGIYGGICTTTEAGAFGAMGALIIAFVSRQMNIKKLWSILCDAVKTVGMILFLIAGTYVFIQFLNASRLPQFVTEWITTSFNSTGVVILMVALLYIVLGMVMPQMCMMMLTVPILWPAMQALDLHYIWFGIFVTMMQGLGGVTPPIGMLAYMVSGMARVNALKVFKGLIPFIIAYLFVIVLICLFPAIVTFLPSFM